MGIGGVWAWVNDNAAGLSAVAAIATGVMAVLALARTAQDSRERSRPLVLAEFTEAANSDTVIDLVVRNVGLTVARSLTVQFDPVPVVPADRGPFVTDYTIERYSSPMLVLAPGQELRNIWWSGEIVSGNFLENAEPTPDQVKVTVAYRGAGRRTYRDAFDLDVDSVKLTTYAVSNTSMPGRLKSIDSHLAKIATAAAQLSRAARVASPGASLEAARARLLGKGGES